MVHTTTANFSAFISVNVSDIPNWVVNDCESLPQGQDIIDLDEGEILTFTRKVNERVIENVRDILFNNNDSESIDPTVCDFMVMVKRLLTETK